MVNDKKVTSFTDIPADVDGLGIGNYISGLSHFVLHCNTPMTISIQGGWGSGKSSIMKMVEKDLEKSEKTINIWFDTWQFSQFNMDDQLVLSLIASLINKLESVNEKDKNEINGFIKVLKYATLASKEIALAVIDSKIGSRVAANIEAFFEDSDKGDSPLINAIENLHKKFEDCINKALENLGKERVIIFIDDLDRLEPKKAVEVMEILKLFLDASNCVFILAIDYEVVCKGVEEKFGHFYNENDEKTDKGKQFFDKIIQVPFKMPVGKYDIVSFVKQCFLDMDEEKTESDLDYSTNIIKKSIGKYPRSIKRLFNSYQLLKGIVRIGSNDSFLDDSRNQLLLFSFLCLQLFNERVYDFLLDNIDSLSEEVFRAIIDNDYEQLENMTLDLDDLKEIDLIKVNSFMVEFKNILFEDNDKNINIEKIQDVLNITAVTSQNEISNEKTSGTINVASIEELKFDDSIQFENARDIIEKISVITGIDKDKFKYSYTVLTKKNNGIKFKNQIKIPITGQKIYLEIFERASGFSVELKVDKELINDKEDREYSFKDITSPRNCKLMRLNVKNNDKESMDTAINTIEYFWNKL